MLEMIEKYKYPRTPHLPFSESSTDSDKRLDSDEHFYEMEDVVVTIKMDGENTTVYPDGTFHARSLDSKHKEYHSWLLQDIQNWCYSLEPNTRVCGEYLYAKHSIAYNDLESYFYAFSVWQKDYCLPFSKVLDLYDALGVYHVPTVYAGRYDREKIKKLAEEVVSAGHEGIVVRNYNGFRYQDFSKNIAKYVRPNHVQTNKHWTQGKIESNKLIQVVK